MFLFCVETGTRFTQFIQHWRYVQTTNRIMTVSSEFNLSVLIELK